MSDISPPLSRRQIRDDLDEELDDFNLHNLKDLDTSTKLSLPRELDLQSTTSSSSTVVHNQNTNNDTKFEHENLNLNTLESDPILQNKIQTSLKLALLEEEDTFHDETLQSQDEHDPLSEYMEGLLPSPPSSPPRELDPNKLYALFDFNGPEPSHLELFKNESVILLNDSDSYWWLVKRIDSEEIGFAPAEILETYQERLARLNCWKNEIVERGESNELNNEQRKLFDTKYEDSILVPLQNTESVISIERKGSLKKNGSSNPVIKKTVSFADIDELNSDDLTTSPLNTGKTVKRISDTNFLVKNLDDYKGEEDDDHEIDGYVDNDVDSFLDEPLIVTNDISTHMSNSTGSLSEPVKLIIPKNRKVPPRNGKPVGKSSESMRMLEDLLQSFDEVDKPPQETTEPLHPVVSDIFDPLFAQVNELDQILQTMDLGNKSRYNY